MRRIANLWVSDIVMGCAGIGQSYAGHSAGDSEVVRSALASDINLFDTAPSYGDSELILGKSLRGENAYISTKFRPETSQTLDQSKHYLAHLDLLAVHNFTADSLQSDLSNFRQHAQLLGATVYEVTDAEAGIKSGIFDFIQVPYNLLDQRFASVFPLAKQRHCSLILRSPLLRGMLTSKALSSPTHFEAVNSLRQRLDCDWVSLPSLALRFSLMTDYPVLLGLSRVEEVRAAMDACEIGPLRYGWQLDAIRKASTTEARLIDPRLFS